jgi:hypothetical protein
MDALINSAGLRSPALDKEVALMRRVMLLATVALVMAAMLAMWAGPVMADGNPGCGIYFQNEYATESEPGAVGDANSGGAAPRVGLGNAAGANDCSEIHPSP